MGFGLNVRVEKGKRTVCVEGITRQGLLATPNQHLSLLMLRAIPAQCNYKAVSAL